MPSVIHQSESDRLKQRVLELGQKIRQRRKVLGVSATTAAQAAGMSRVTWHRIEKGSISVTIGAWFNALAVLGLEFGIGSTSVRGDTATDDVQGDGVPSVPVEIRLRDYPQLQALAWQVKGTDTVTAREAFDIYGRNRRHLDWESIRSSEKLLINALETLFGESDHV